MKMFLTSDRHLDTFREKLIFRLVLYFYFTELVSLASQPPPSRVKKTSIHNKFNEAFVYRSKFM
jgi:hypothetical protein